MKPNDPQGKPTKNRAFKRHLNTFLTAVAKPTVVPRSCPIPSAMISNPDLSRGMLLPHIHSRNLYLDIYIYYTRYIYIDIYIYMFENNSTHTRLSVKQCQALCFINISPNKTTACVPGFAGYPSDPQQENPVQPAGTGMFHF